MTKQELTALAINISRTYNEIATDLSKRITTHFEKGDISAKEFMKIQNETITPLINQSTNIAVKIAIEVSNDIEDNFLKIKEGTVKLKAEIDSIAETEKIVKLGAKIITSAALITAFVIAPNPASGLAAIGSVADLISDLKANKDDNADDNTEDDEDTDK